MVSSLNIHWVSADCHAKYRGGKTISEAMLQVIYHSEYEPWSDWYAWAVCGFGCTNIALTRFRRCAGNNYFELCFHVNWKSDKQDMGRYDKGCKRMSPCVYGKQCSFDNQRQWNETAVIGVKKANCPNHNINNTSHSELGLANTALVGIVYMYTFFVL